MLPPLYQAGQRDLVYGVLPQRYLETVSGTASAAIVQSDASEAVESQYIVLLEYLAVKLTGSSAQTPYDWGLELKGVGTAHTVTGCVEPVGGGASRSEWWYGRRLSCALSEGEWTQLTSHWSAGVTSNVVEYTLWGWKIPRGNMQPLDIGP